MDRWIQLCKGNKVHYLMKKAAMPDIATVVFERINLGLLKYNKRVNEKAEKKSERWEGK